MNNIKTLLKVTSEYRSHVNNQAKEFVLLNNYEFLEIGKECIIINSNLYVIEKHENKISFIKYNDKYTLCYGLSLTNVITLLTNKKCDILSINIELDNYNRKTYLITLKNHNQYNTFSFNETINLNNFENTELGYYIIQLYKKEIENEETI